MIAIDQKPVAHLDWLPTALLRIPPGTCEQNFSWLTRFGLSPLRLSQTSSSDLFAINPSWEQVSPQRFAALNLPLPDKNDAPVNVINSPVSVTNSPANTTSSPLVPMQFRSLSKSEKISAFQRALAKCGELEFFAGEYPYPDRARLTTITQEKIVFTASTTLTIIAPQPELLAAALGLTLTSDKSTSSTTATLRQNSPNSASRQHSINSVPRQHSTNSVACQNSANTISRQSDLASHQSDGESSFSQVKLLHPHEWMRLTPTSVDTVLAIEPRSELVRLLNTVSFQGNLEALAATPFQRATGLWLEAGRLHLVRIVTEENNIS